MVRQNALRALPGAEQLTTDAFTELVTNPEVARRLDLAAREVKREEVIPDEEMDEVFNG